MWPSEQAGLTKQPRDAQIYSCLIIPSRPNIRDRLMFPKRQFGAHRKETGPKPYKECFLSNADERPVSCLMSHVSSPSCVSGRKQVAPPPLAVRYRRLQG